MAGRELRAGNRTQGGGSSRGEMGECSAGPWGKEQKSKREGQEGLAFCKGAQSMYTGMDGADDVFFQDPGSWPAEMPEY